MFELFNENYSEHPNYSAERMITVAKTHEMSCSFFVKMNIFYKVNVCEAKYWFSKFDVLPK